ncbi:MAG: hypothetical protein JNL90_11250 [Planctomycetes bacterium]|nr:hypothetical protein [Planctomycetota bacterium]
MGYDHTQRGVLHRWFTVLSGALVIGGAVAGSTLKSDDGRAIALILVAVGLFLGLLGAAIAWLRVHDDGDALRIAFGPLALFRRRVPYAAMRGAKAIALGWSHGIGIHLAPGGGWTWNVRGGAAVEITLERGRLLVSSDDPNGLVAFLRQRAKLAG